MRNKYNFSELLTQDEVQFDFSPSARVSVIVWAKKNNLKISTKKVEDKLVVKKK